MRLPILFSLSSVLLLLENLPAQAVQTSNGKVYFADPPQLVRTITTQDDVYIPFPEYDFTISIPADAGEPIEKVVIQQQLNYNNYLDFEVQPTRVYWGANYHSPSSSPSQVTYDPDHQALVIRFKPPLAPGQTVTLGLFPVQNPGVPGIYLFGITAYPPGPRVHGQFLGYGRLTFYDHSLR